MRRFALAAISMLALAGGAASQVVVSGYGKGCPGTNNQVPDIGVSGALGLGKTTIWQTIRARPSSPAVLIFGLRQVAIPVGGTCRLLAVPIVLTSTRVNGNGVASVPVPFPNDQGLRGTDFLFQYLVVDPAGKAFGTAAMTNGVKLRFL